MVIFDQDEGGGSGAEVGSAAPSPSLSAGGRAGQRVCGVAQPAALACRRAAAAAARPFAALRQIRAGQFHGYSWDHGRRVTHIVGGYRPVETLGEALTLWGKHLVADLVTPMSLPLPGWTALYQLPSHQMRTFAHQTYDHSLNTRWAALSTLPVLTTEIVVRTHVHGRAMLAHGTAVLQPAEAAQRSELLLAGHALVGAVSLGKALTLAPATRSPIRDYRHLNWPVLVRRDHLPPGRRRCPGARS